jgi:hypothetical protein
LIEIAAMVSTELLQHSEDVTEATLSTSKALEVLTKTWAAAKNTSFVPPQVVVGIPVSVYMGEVVDLTHTADGCDECGADKTGTSACGKSFCAEHLTDHCNKCLDCKATTTSIWKIGEHQVSTKWHQACAIITAEPQENFLVWCDFVTEMSIMLSLLKEEAFASVRQGINSCFSVLGRAVFGFFAAETKQPVTEILEEAASKR